MSHKVLLASSSLLAGLAFCTQVCAAEGKFDWQSCYSGASHVLQHADGMVSGSYDATAMSPGTEGTPMYMLSGRCVGYFTIINGDYNESGGCEYQNAAGDKYFGVYARKGDPAKAEGTWHVVHGTGKFAGISMEGKWIPISTFPPVRTGELPPACNHEWGAYSIK
jgi:hypothetical protein